MHRTRRKKARLTFFERQFSLWISEALGTLAGQDIDKFIERVTVIIWLLAGGMLSHMKFVGLSCRDKRLTVCVERLERFFTEARRYYFVRLFKFFGYHLLYGSLRLSSAISLALVAVKKLGIAAGRHSTMPQSFASSGSAAVAGSAAGDVVSCAVVASVG